MRRLLLAFTALALWSAAALAGPYYVRGNFYCHDGVNNPAPDNTCWGWDAGNELFDDGLHGDGIAGDGIHGAYVTCDQPAGRLQWKIATNDWAEAYPTSPFDALANAVLFTDGPGDVIHFVLDTRPLPDGWQPFWYGVATDHYLPPGAELEVIGSAPELGGWLSGIPAAHVGQRWQRVVTIDTPGTYQFKFRVVGTWDVASFGPHYSNTAGEDATFTTTLPNTDVLFQLDNATGRVRGIELGPTPTLRTSWGRLKTRYR
jgi:hypothetical protein